MECNLCDICNKNTPYGNKEYCLECYYNNSPRSFLIMSTNKNMNFETKYQILLKEIKTQAKLSMYTTKELRMLLLEIEKQRREKKFIKSHWDEIYEEYSHVMHLRNVLNYIGELEC